VYAQLVRQVEQAVRTGRLRPGDRLPTAREVADTAADLPPGPSRLWPGATAPARRR
jgi:hypothetical protein